MPAQRLRQTLECLGIQAAVNQVVAQRRLDRLRLLINLAQHRVREDAGFQSSFDH